MSQSRNRDEEFDSTSEMEDRRSLVVGRQRKDRSGEYPRTEHAALDDDAIFATLSADVDAAVDRMQRQLDESGDPTLRDTSEIAPIQEEASAISARFKVDGSVVASPRTSMIRELQPDGDGSSRPEIDAPVFEKTLLGPSLLETREVPNTEPLSDVVTLEQSQQIQDVDETEEAPMLAFQHSGEVIDDYDDDGKTALDDSFAGDDDALGYDDDGFTELDRDANFDEGDANFDEGDDVTSPSRAYQLAGREQTYDPSEIDDVVQFHEGPTGVSMGHHLHSGPGDTEERMHPWFDGGPVRAPLAQSSGPTPDTKPHNAPHSPPGTFSPSPALLHQESVREQSHAAYPTLEQIERFVRAFVEKCSTTTLQINLGYLLIVLAAVGLFATTTFLAWLIASP